MTFLVPASGKVNPLERESQPGYHTTGRSAALFVETYGNAVIRAIGLVPKRRTAFTVDPPMGPRPSRSSRRHRGRRVLVFKTRGLSPSGQPG